MTVNHVVTMMIVYNGANDTANMRVRMVRCYWGNRINEYAYDGTSTVNITISLYILLQRQGKRFANANHILHTALVSFSSSPGL